MRYQMKWYFRITANTTLGPQCDFFQSNFAFRVNMDLHLHRVYILVTLRAS